MTFYVEYVRDGEARVIRAIDIDEAYILATALKTMNGTFDVVVVLR